MQAVRAVVGVRVRAVGVHRMKEALLAPQTIMRNAVNCSDPRAESFLKSWHGKRYEMRPASGIAV